MDTSFTIKITVYLQDIITAMINQNISVSTNSIKTATECVRDYMAHEYRQEGHLREEILCALSMGYANDAAKAEKPSSEGAIITEYDISMKDLSEAMKDSKIETTGESIKEYADYIQRYFQNGYRDSGHLIDDMESILENYRDEFETN